MKVLIASDSFKGSLTSLEIGNIFKKSLKKVGINSIIREISDGGEGFLEAIKKSLKGRYQYFFVKDPLFRNHFAKVLLVKNTYYVELAKVIGITYVKVNDQTCYDASSYGLGQLLLKLLKRHPESIIISIGGSASSDAGSGLLEALGIKFFDKFGNKMTNLSNRKLPLIANIDFSNFDELFKDTKITYLTDVDNPLLGEKGAVNVFGRQKGAKEEDLVKMEYNVEYFVKSLPVAFMNNINLPGSGAAGGIGFMLSCIVNSTRERGIDFFMNETNFLQDCEESDILITGEGSFDNQSFDGKVISGCLKVFNKRIIIICGQSKIKDENLEIYPICPDITTLSNSMKYPKKYLKILAERIANILKEKALKN